MRSKQEIRGIVDGFAKSGMTAAGLLRETQDRHEHAGLLAARTKRQAKVS
jgi:hypothetical protein